ncbi:cupin domain-containing protein [Lysobacter sp. GX 14042]|uniref:ribosomal protein uL16 3-hydroxylase n=1 Tax=Lysobacter sp. GX 14042 TaxID=2907155 RepID=UPI001F42B3B8|nr:cupin domain-containing protein [Lysobacter sp. GX 14042]MCE7031256.1 cupin domain-containing protein [Lysobacter sp. GX 14042]
MPPADFLRDYWQKRPLLVRNAFAGYRSPIEPGDLAGLACEDGVLARIVRHDRQRDAWTLETGPFPEEKFPGMPDHDWTLLVQDVDKWDPDIAALLEHFGFLPRWRLDDIMVSFAAPGGSVGAHVDQYDVFLLQAHGHRRWQIDAGANPPTDFRDDVELKLLRRFHPSHDWVLGPGDMLYLPPGVPHHGVAEDACLTFSVGMRAPSSAELLGDYVDHVLAAADDSTRYQDPDLALPDDPARIDAAALDRVRQALDRLRTDPAALGDWFGRFITTYRNAVEVAPAPDLPTPAETGQALAAGLVLHRHPYSRMAWHGDGADTQLFANGEAWHLPQADARCLANARVLDAATVGALSPAGRACLDDLVQAGHFLLSGDGD